MHANLIVALQYITDTHTHAHAHTHTLTHLNFLEFQICTGQFPILPAEHCYYIGGIHK